jgi:hypothetical protein
MDANRELRAIVPKVSGLGPSSGGKMSLDEVAIFDDSAAAFNDVFKAKFPDADPADPLLNKVRSLLLANGCPATGTGILRDGSGFHKKRGPPPKARLPAAGQKPHRATANASAAASVTHSPMYKRRRVEHQDEASLDLMNATREDSSDSLDSNDDSTGNVSSHSAPNYASEPSTTGPLVTLGLACANHGRRRRAAT